MASSFINQRDLKHFASVHEQTSFNNSQSAMRIVTQSDCNNDESLILGKRLLE